MDNNELYIKLKGVLDMTVFSQLLEMDEEEDRKSSSTALCGFIEGSQKKVNHMEISLPKRDFVSLIFKSESLQQCAEPLGFRKLHESCANIERVGAMMSIHGEVAEASDMFHLTLIKEEIQNLNDSLLSARTAINSYKILAKCKTEFGSDVNFSKPSSF
ncbi:uncharacterized protein N7469_002172 [Penicillium citrinum]|uniref:Uncharacterized protein n=1 Tax=Penicillium citrinum TaxID=5077 RepID=A0A9W9PAQ4_PENCI|nr:uncharacterized protein N7469_002172 [Penicillium citrinum]KAJ5240581.1 hypothetical protein N7469_002172 [Penicillium citrinum]